MSVSHSKCYFFSLLTLTSPLVLRKTEGRLTIIILVSNFDRLKRFTLTEVHSWLTQLGGFHERVAFLISTAQSPAMLFMYQFVRCNSHFITSDLVVLKELIFQTVYKVICTLENQQQLITHLSFSGEKKTI